MKAGSSIAAIMIRIGFWYIFYYKNNQEPPKIVYLFLLLCGHLGPMWARPTKIAQAIIRVVVNIRAPFRVLIILRHLIFRVPKKGTLILTTSLNPKPFIEPL